MKILILLFSLFWIDHSIAKPIYKETLDNGEVIFSDTAQPKSEAIELQYKKASTNANNPTAPTPDPKNAPEPSPPPAESPASSESTAPDSYKMSFISPQNAQVYTVDKTHVEVDLQVEPKLYPEHKIRLMIDHHDYGPLQSGTHYILSTLERGTHILEAKIYTKNGESLGSAAPVEIHIQKPIIKQNRP